MSQVKFERKENIRVTDTSKVPDHVTDRTTFAQ